jgi:hypothetical protein
MIAQVIVNKLLEADDDVDRYLSGVVGPEASLLDLDNALVSRGFQFWEYDPQKKVLVNRWVYKQGDEFWVINPVFHLQPEKDYWNIQLWRNNVLIRSESGKMRDMIAYFDRHRRA